ncbi:MAG: chaperone modulator CbpM [Brumimicrobium sp.]|nr:chaperone modulator CbpM [Brumimicrobium sp.]
MAEIEFIEIRTLCRHYEIEYSFVEGLVDIGLVEFHIIEQKPHISKEYVSDLERIIRIHKDLNINVEGIDAVFNLLKRLEKTENELKQVKNRLRIYESTNK